MSEESAAAPAPETNRAVFDLAQYGSLRIIEALANSGLITDEQRTPLQILRRITQALNDDISDMPKDVQEDVLRMRREFNIGLANTPSYQEFVEAGHVQKLLETYVPLLARAGREKKEALDHGVPPEGSDTRTFNDARANEEAKENKYSLEAPSYSSDFMKNMIKETALKHEAVITSGRYLPMSDIAVESGYVHEDKAVARDLVDDVTSVQAALAIKAIRKAMVDGGTLAEYAGNPDANAVRIQAMAERIAQVTHSLASLKAPETTSPVVPLLELVSAEMHEAMSQHRNPQQAVKTEAQALSDIKAYEQVAYSLAVDFLKDGPSAEDTRTKAILANLERDLQAQGIEVLPLEEAKRKAAELARRSAEDLLRAAHGNEALSEKINGLAQAAGVDLAVPLEPKTHLIGEELLELLKDKMQQDNVIMPRPEELASFVKRVEKKRGDNPSLALGA